MKTELMGLVPDMPNEIYHGMTGYLSSTGLLKLRRSAEHFQAYITGPQKTTVAKEFGSSFHDLLGTPDLFARRYAKGPRKEDYPTALFTSDDIKQRLAALEVKLPAKASKPELVRTLLAAEPGAVIWDNVIACFEKENEGKTILSAEDFDRLDGMLGSILKNKTVLELVRGGVAEQSIFWIDPRTGTRCKCRPDYLRPDFITSDWKTTEDASPEGFKRAVRTYRYDLKTAHYLRGISSIAKEPITEFIHVAVEKQAPYAIGLYALTDETLKCADSENQELLALHAECVKKNNWPAYSPDIQDVDMTYLYTR